MCGISGFWLSTLQNGDTAEAQIRAMTDCMAHRGPDASGTWRDDAAGLALGHRRLSILDLSPLGAQPMASADGKLIMVYNGEVYNCRALAEELRPLRHTFRGSSDTEVMLAAIREWGLERAVSRFVGMFAFALWDKAERTLHLVRDRLGIKPLYYGCGNGSVLFGSELKALRAHPEFDAEIDRDALALYFRHNYIPAPYSIYQGVRKVLPGTILTFSAPGEPPREERYWSAEEVWSRGTAEPFTGSDEEAANRLEALLKDAIGLRMLSDVPIGAFLSGGIDSSVVAALMQQLSPRPVKTFSIGFNEERFNEAHHAKLVAEHLGTDHTELYLRPDDLLDIVPDIPEFWDEPFSDSGQFTAHAVCRLARNDVTVALSGDGGDELFLGYDRYFLAGQWRRVARVPHLLRRLACAIGKGLPSALFSLSGLPGDKVRWRLNALTLQSFQEFYRYAISHHKNPEEFVTGSREPETTFSGTFDTREDVEMMRRMSLWDVQQYLPDDILTKMDRASMAVSLEARVPILDHRVVEFAASLPLHMKIRDGQSKWLLRQVLHRHVPEALVDRPKMGFGVPVENWLKGPLREWADTLLAEDRLGREGFLAAGSVRSMWQDYLAGERNWNYYIWDVLMFESWLEHHHG